MIRKQPECNPFQKSFRINRSIIEYSKKSRFSNDKQYRFRFSRSSVGSLNLIFVQLSTNSDTYILMINFHIMVFPEFFLLDQLLPLIPIFLLVMSVLLKGQYQLLLSATRTNKLSLNLRQDSLRALGFPLRKEKAINNKVTNYQRKWTPIYSGYQSPAYPKERI